METKITQKIIEHMLLQHKLNSIIDPNWYKNLKVSDYSRAIKSELFEAYDSIPWQWWKKAEFDFYNFKIELIDAYHFMLSSFLLTSGIVNNLNALNNLNLLLSEDSSEISNLNLHHFRTFGIDIKYLKGVVDVIADIFTNADKIRLYLYNEDSFIKHDKDGMLFNNSSTFNFDKILNTLEDIVSDLRFEITKLDNFSIISDFFELCAMTMTFYEFDLLYRIKNRINQLRQQKQYKETLKARLLNGKDDNEFIIDLLYKEQVVKSYYDFEKILEQVL